MKKYKNKSPRHGSTNYIRKWIGRWVDERKGGRERRKQRADRAKYI